MHRLRRPSRCGTHSSGCRRRPARSVPRAVVAITDFDAEEFGRLIESGAGPESSPRSTIHWSRRRALSCSDHADSHQRGDERHSEYATLRAASTDADDGFAHRCWPSPDAAHKIRRYCRKVHTSCPPRTITYAAAIHRLVQIRRAMGEKLQVTSTLWTAGGRPLQPMRRSTMRC